MLGFRVDANEKIATGHLMRCMAIAVQCMKLGEKCIFILAEEKETKRLKEKNIPYYILNTKWDNMDEEKELMKSVIEEEKLDWLVVDSYQATVSYLEYLQQFVSVLYIDDMVKEKYPVSAVLHYSQWKDDTSYEEKYMYEKTKVLSGMEYTPLREEFFQSCVYKEREKSILITTGGTDTYNVAGKLLKELQKRSEFEVYKFHVIVGSLNQNRQILEDMAKKDTRILLHQNIKNMSEFMKQSECAVSAGGTTLFELCASKIPTVCFSFAENQEEFVREMEKRQIMLCAGDARTENEIEKTIANKLYLFIKNKKMRDEYANRMGNLVDGKGSVRIAENLCFNNIVTLKN